MYKLLFLLLFIGLPLMMKGQPPVITSLSPIKGAAGSSVTIKGNNFNASASGNIVFFGGGRATVNSATSNQLVVSVPPGASYQAVTVTDTSTGLTGYSSIPFLPVFTGKGTISSGGIEAKVDINAGGNLAGVALTDIDGDGKLEVITLSATVNKVSVHRNTFAGGALGSGSFSVATDLSINVTGSCLSTGDVNGDGKQDIVVGYEGNKSITVFFNTSTPGNISFSGKTDIITGGAASALGIWDIDGDGRADVVEVSRAGNNVTILRNTGNAGIVSFGNQISYGTGSQPGSLCLADINGDGKADIITGNYIDRSVSVLLNQSEAGAIGAGSFAVKKDYQINGNPTGISVADIDGDGWLDVLAANYNTQHSMLTILHNTANSGILSAAVDFSTGSEPVGISIADVDGDGKADVVVNNYNSNTVSVLKNMAISGAITTGSLSAKTDFATGSVPLALVAGDIDGDGQPDLVTANDAGKNTSILRNTSTLPVKLTAAFNNNGHLIVTGHLPKPVSQNIFVNIRSYYAQGGPVYTINAGITIPAGMLDGPAYDFGDMIHLVPGSFTVILHPIGEGPASVDGMPVNWSSDSYNYLSAHYSDTTTLTFGGAISNGHLLVTGHASKPIPIAVTVDMSGYYTQNGRREMVENNFTMPANTTDSSPADIGDMTGLTTGPFTLWLHAVNPSATAVESSQVILKGDSTFNLTATYSGTNQVSFTAAIDSNNHLLLTPHLAQIASLNISTSGQVYYIQNGTTTRLGVVDSGIPANSLDAPAIDCGAMTNLVSGSFQIHFLLNYINVSEVNGMLVSCPADFYLNLIKP